MGELRTVKLASGEEFIGELVKDSPGVMVFKYPLRIQVVHHPQQGTMVAAEPLMTACDDEELSINTSHIVCSGSVSEHLAQTWREKFGDLYVPPAPKIIT